MGNIFLFVSLFLLTVSSVYPSYLGLVDKYKKTIPEFGYLNTSVDPCEDFYEFCCGNFKNIEPLPDGRRLWDGFQKLQQQLDGISNSLLSTPHRISDSEVVKKSKAMYQSCMNLQLIDHLDLAPLRNIINDFGGWPLITNKSNWNFTWEMVADTISKYGIPFLFEINIRPNLNNAKENIIYLTKDSVNLPSQYPPKQGKDSPYTKYLIKIALALRENPFEVTDEKVIEGVQKTVQMMNDIKLYLNVTNYNLTQSDVISVKELQQLTNKYIGEDYEPAIKWLPFLQTIFKPVNIIISEDTNVFVLNPHYLLAVLDYVKEQNPEMLINFMISRLMTFISPDTNEHMRNAHDEYYVLPPDYGRWMYCLRKITDYPNIGLSPAITQIYQKYYFNTKTLNTAKEMVGDLQSAFNDILDESDWMDLETKLYAKQKLENMMVLIGYSDIINNNSLFDEYYKDLKICKHDFVGNTNRLRRFMYQDNLKTLSQPTDRTRWSMSPLYVNGFYHKTENKVSFPLSLMNPPFYSGRESFIDYGRIGSFIGHEITHGYDSQGKSFDADGSYKNWWKNETENEYNLKAKCFIEQYNSYEIIQLGGIKVNGALTLGENIADNGGLREAYKAYEKLKDRLLSKKKSFYDNIEDYTSDQLFFIAQGTMWCRVIETLLLFELTNTDPHAPNEFRVNGPVSNFNKFSEAFNCPLGSNMNPKNKCILW